MRERICHLLQIIIQSINADLPMGMGLTWNSNCPLAGPDRILDSLGIVMFMTTVEQAIAEDFKVNISLSDVSSKEWERFYTVGTFTDYLVELMECSGRKSD